MLLVVVWAGAPGKALEGAGVVAEAGAVVWAGAVVVVVVDEVVAGA